MQVPNIRIEEEVIEKMLSDLLDNFVSNFEAARSDRVFQQLMISAPPISTAFAFADGLIAATAKHLAVAYGLRVPAWVHDEWRSGAERLTTGSSRTCTSTPEKIAVAA
jgi:hypothetical protein